MSLILVQYYTVIITGKLTALLSLYLKYENQFLCPAVVYSL
jgi:hypothetical protein